MTQHGIRTLVAEGSPSRVGPEVASTSDGPAPLGTTIQHIADALIALDPEALADDDLLALMRALKDSAQAMTDTQQRLLAEVQRRYGG